MKRALAGKPVRPLPTGAAPKESPGFLESLFNRLGAATSGGGKDKAPVNRFERGGARDDAR
jgi:hypothetical protein